MNFIIYLLDGLTPLAIKNEANQFFFQKKIKKNYISILQRRSINFSNLYGYGETFSTTYEFFTGQNIYKSDCDAFQSINSFPEKDTLATFFKKKKFNTILFRDPMPNHNTNWSYKRYFKSISKDFDEICLKKKDNNYNFRNFFHDHKISNYLNKNNFFLFHDFSLHDNPRAYHNPTPKGYLEAVNKSSKIIKNNLQLIKYDESKDILIFLSDHGLNMFPENQMHAQKKIGLIKYKAYYKSLFADEKIKSVFFIKYPKSKKINNDVISKPKKVFDVVKGLSKFIFNKKKFKKFILRNINYKDNYIINSVKAATQDPFNNLFFKEGFHCHFILINKVNKISYSHNHQFAYYDLISKKHIPEKEVPVFFKNYIKNYFRNVNVLKKFIKLLPWFIYILTKNFKFFYKVLLNHNRK